MSWKGENNLLGKINNIEIINGIFNILTGDIFWKRLFANDFLSILGKKWFSSYKFLTNTFI